MVGTIVYWLAELAICSANSHLALSFPPMSNYNGIIQKEWPKTCPKTVYTAHKHKLLWSSWAPEFLTTDFQAPGNFGAARFECNSPASRILSTYILATSIMTLLMPLSWKHLCVHLYFWATFTSPLLVYKASLVIHSVPAVVHSYIQGRHTYTHTHSPMQGRK